MYFQNGWTFALKNIHVETKRKMPDQSFIFPPKVCADKKGNWLKVDHQWRYLYLAK